MAAELIPTGSWPRMMSKSRSAAYLDISERSFERLVSSGAIVGKRVSGKLIRYPKEALDELVESFPTGQGDRPG